MDNKHLPPLTTSVHPWLKFWLDLIRLRHRSILITRTLHVGGGPHSLFTDYPDTAGDLGDRVTSSLPANNGQSFDSCRLWLLCSADRGRGQALEDNGGDTCQGLIVTETRSRP